jgi:hypothetical protein
MGILDELETRKNKSAALEQWIESRPKKERDEWLEAFARGDLYSVSALQDLLARHGHETDKNAIYRVRIKQPNYRKPAR